MGGVIEDIVAGGGEWDGGVEKLVPRGVGVVQPWRKRTVAKR
jgi:hypothetical protein